LNITAQVGVNTVAPGDGSILDVTSTDKGVLIPRINIADLSTIAPVAVTSAGEESLLVYNTNVTTGKGFHYWDGSDWIALTPPEDGDFYKVGTSTAPTAITDDVFRTGKMAIGKTSGSAALDVQDNVSANAINVESTGSSNVLNVKRSGSKAGTARGIYVDYVNDEASADVQQGIATYIRGGAGTGTRYGVYNDVQSFSGGTNQIIGTYNQLNSGNGTGDHIGIYNRLAGNTSRTKKGLNNYITGTDDGEHIGIATNLSGTGTGNHTGVENIIRGAGNLKGIYNTFSNLSGDGQNTGMETQNTNDGDGVQKGVHTRLDGDGTGDKIGTTNYITSQNGTHIGISNVLKRDGSQTGTTGTGDKTAVYNNINQSEGDNYGVYNLINATVTGKTSYGTFNKVISNDGTNIAGYFTASATDTAPVPVVDKYYAAFFNKGSVVLKDLQVFADNTAASSLEVGEMYRTATGVLMVRY
jgi:hypothetical protein